MRGCSNVASAKTQFVQLPANLLLPSARVAYSVSSAQQPEWVVCFVLFCCMYQAEHRAALLCLNPSGAFLDP